MILTLNVGNTHITMGGYENDQLIFSARLRTDMAGSSDEYAIKLDDLLRLNGRSRADVDGAILGSVVPVLTGPLLSALHKLFSVKVLTVGPGLKSGLQLRIDNPAQLGAELLCAAVAALEEAEAPLVIINVDTALSMMAVNKQRQLVGGLILPGPQLSMNALVKGTAQLPQVDFRTTPGSVLATNTVACLQAGGILGTACMLDGLLDRFKEELGGEITVFATGTLASAIRSSCRTPILYRKTLILDGLYAIWRRNTK
ncbi:MAG: type III pantothenate kinase [Oscillospiraceae bacterium]|nr:type III pantothenate kinase [Oscillospiraceae bacterium]